MLKTNITRDRNTVHVLDYCICRDPEETGVPVSYTLKKLHTAQDSYEGCDYFSVSVNCRILCSKIIVSLPSTETRLTSLPDIWFNSQRVQKCNFSKSAIHYKLLTKISQFHSVSSNNSKTSGNFQSISIFSIRNLSTDQLLCIL